ncbi:hypothetical protein [Mucilaginibacter pineti]|nr:hypothetical protein [Mucilaginibacter pineti]
MKTILLMLFALSFYSCKKNSTTVDQADKAPALSVGNTTMSSFAAAVTTVTKNDPADNSKNVQALIKSNVTLYFPKATYKFTNFVSIKNINNLKIYAEPGTVFVTNQNKIIEIYGTTSDIDISFITFQSTKVSAIEDTEGLIFVANYGINDIMNTIAIHDCSFSNPNTLCDAIKVVSEGVNAVAKNIVINNNTFKSIGRFGVELQNNLYVPMIARITNYNITNNKFEDVGTIQKGPASSCVSLTGYSLNGVVNNNYFLNMRMNTTGSVYYGIENAGAVNLQTNGNTFTSNTYGFTGILGSGPTPAESSLRNQPQKSMWYIENNTFNLTGSATDKTKIRAIDLADTHAYFIENNTMKTDGQNARFTNCYDGIISGNIMQSSTSGSVLYFQSSSIKNKVTGNTITAKGGGDTGTVFFEGQSVNNNYAYSNTLYKATGKAGDYRNWNGAYNNFW